MIKTRDISIASIFVAIITLSAQIIIPIPYVPFTLQLFTVSLMAFILSNKQIVLTLAVYTLLGLIGFPIFAGFSFGIMKPSFGFVIGFLPYALLLKRSKISALFLLYGFGLTYLALYLSLFLKINLNPIQIITSYGLIYLPTDIVAISIAGKLAKRRFR